MSTKELGTFCKVAKKSTNLKGIFRKYIWETNTRIFAAYAILNIKGRMGTYPHTPSPKGGPALGGIQEENIQSLLRNSILARAAEDQHYNDEGIKVNSSAHKVTGLDDPLDDCVGQRR